MLALAFDRVTNPLQAEVGTFAGEGPRRFSTEGCIYQFERTLPSVRTPESRFDTTEAEKKTRDAYNKKYGLNQ